jgi:hypothetical protein
LGQILWDAAKLIEVAVPLAAINAESAREKSIRHGHPSTLHLWWARRPLAACRAFRRAAWRLRFTVTNLAWVVGAGLGPEDGHNPIAIEGRDRTRVVSYDVACGYVVRLLQGFTTPCL